MSYSLNVKAFFFNAKTDYLPYYKNFAFTLPKDANAKAILEAIQLENENFAYPTLNLVFKINDLVVDEDTPLSNIVSKLGSTLTIDPVTSYRSNNGLIINNHDFMQHFDLLAPYATESDKEYYKSLYALHYASETSNFDRDYIGDAILVLAHKMISEGNEHKKEILKAITSVDSGLFDCEYENNMFNTQSYESSITALKEMLKSDRGTSSFLDMIKKRFLKKKTEEIKTIENLVEKQVAYYPGHNENSEIQEKIEALEISCVTFDRMYKLSGVSIVEDNKTLAFKKAGAILLDAFDAGAEVVIVEDESAYRMFSKNFTAIENVIGRKMIGLELISSADFIVHSSKAVA